MALVRREPGGSLEARRQGTPAPPGRRRNKSAKTVDSSCPCLPRSQGEGPLASRLRLPFQGHHGHWPHPCRRIWMGCAYRPPTIESMMATASRMNKNAMAGPPSRPGPSSTPWRHRTARMRTRYSTHIASGWSQYCILTVAADYVDPLIRWLRRWREYEHETPGKRQIYSEEASRPRGGRGFSGSYSL